MGKAITAHPDLETFKGRGASKTVTLVNSLLAFVFLVLLIILSWNLAWKSDAFTKNCDASASFKSASFDS